jgi:16S rRNA (guanine(966)-N(2))-methyltransferase RsmD
MMRIITGKARGTRLYTLEGNITRPTAERVKEAVFSMIQFEIEGREVLDLFSGSGQLALEALSRGAAHATLVDVAPEAVEIIKKNAAKTHLADSCTILSSDYASALSRMRGRVKFDIVFLDPPYHKGLVAKSLELLAEYELLKPSALVICESGEADIFGNSPAGRIFDTVKESKYGIVYIHILKLKNNNDSAACPAGQND